MRVIKVMQIIRSLHYEVLLKKDPVLCCKCKDICLHLRCIQYYSELY